jgi:16S rRNA processing protein RimM
MSDANRLVLVGRVAGAFGVRGEVRIRAYTEDPLALLTYRELKRATGEPGLTLLSGRAAKDGVIVRTREVETKEQADALKGLELYAPRSALPAVEDDEFYLTDLIGLEARTPDGTRLGRVRSVNDFGAGDVLEIEPGDGSPSWLIAFTLQNAPEVAIDRGYLVIVRPPETD